MHKAALRPVRARSGARRPIRTVFLHCCLALLLSAGFAATPPQAHAAALKMGILPVIDTLPLQVAVHDGLFVEQGLDVELVPFASALERDTAMQSGLIDGYFGDLLNTLLLIDKGVPMRIATVSYATRKGQPMFGLVTAPGRDGTGMLKTGISKTTVIEYLLDRMVDTAPAGSLDVERVEVKKIPIRLQLLLGGQLDAAVLPEPLLSLAASKGGTVLRTDELLRMPLTVLCLHKDKLGELDGFLSAYAGAVERINARPEDYRELMVSTCRIPPGLAKTFPVYAYPEPKLPTEQEIWPVQQWMLTRGMLGKLLPYDAVVAR